jgi:hypothetical protein
MLITFMPGFAALAALVDDGKRRVDTLAGAARNTPPMSGDTTMRLAMSKRS